MSKLTRCLVYGIGGYLLCVVFFTLPLFFFEASVYQRRNQQSSQLGNALQKRKSMDSRDLHTNIYTNSDESKVLSIWKTEMRKHGFSVLPNNIRTAQTISLKDIPREIQYPEFSLREPNFVNDTDRELFLKLTANKDMLGIQPVTRLKGAIWVMNQSRFHERRDCGYLNKKTDYMGEKMDSRSLKYNDTLMPILVPDSYAFQHFLDGSLPKLMQALDIALLPGVKVMIFAPRDKIILEILDKLGISSKKILFYPPDQPDVIPSVGINTCVAPPLHPFLWQLARSLITGSTDQGHLVEEPSFIILLTRARSSNGGRATLNHLEVETFLRQRYQHNFFIFRGGYDLNQTISIFGRAKILIGVHGGAIYNMNFAPKGTYIVEIIPTDSNGESPRRIAHQIFWLMAGMLEQIYWRLCVSPHSNNGDVIVPIQKLRNVLDKIDHQHHHHGSTVIT